MKHSVRFATASGLSAVMVFAACQNKPAKEPTAEKKMSGSRPNIVLIMADDIMPAHLSCYGGDLTLPHINWFASEGMIFHRAYCTSAASTPSRFNVLTGSFPGRCAHEEFTKGKSKTEPYQIAWNTPLTGNEYTIEKMLSEAGYFTGFVGKFHVGDNNFDDPAVNPAFPRIDPAMSPDDPRADSLLRLTQKLFAEEVKRLTGTQFAAAIQWENPETYPLETIRNHNLEWITEGAQQFFDALPHDRPFFLHFNTTALHGPNHAQSLEADPHHTPGGKLANPYAHQPDRKTIYQRLDSMGVSYGPEAEDHVRHYNTGRLYFDDQVGAILKMLDKAKLSQNTLVIITADHGVEPGKSTTYERGVRVPFIVRWPGVVESGSVSNEPVQFTDFLPTFAELAGVSLDGKQHIDGVSFLPALEQKAITSRKYVYFEAGYTRAVTDGKYKYIAMRFPSSLLDSLNTSKALTVNHFGSKPQFHASIAMKYQPAYFDADQLYDLEIDPYEQNNLAKNPEYRQILAEMQAALQKYTSSIGYAFDLNATGYESTPTYQAYKKKALDLGTDWIPWWKRQLDYPPVN